MVLVSGDSTALTAGGAMKVSGPEGAYFGGISDGAANR